MANGNYDERITSLENSVRELKESDIKITNTSDSYTKANTWIQFFLLIAVALTGYLIFSQLGIQIDQGKSNNNIAAMNFFKEINKEIDDICLVLACEYKVNINDPNQTIDTIYTTTPDDKRISFDQRTIYLINRAEFISLLIKHNIADHDISYEMWGGLITSLHRWCKPRLVSAQKQRPKLAENFVALATKWSVEKK